MAQGTNYILVCTYESHTGSLSTIALLASNPFILMINDVHPALSKNLPTVFIIRVMRLVDVKNRRVVEPNFM